MNAFLAAIFVTTSLIVLGVTALKTDQKWKGSKLGLVFYGLGTLMWSFQGIEAGSVGLVLISIVQTSMVIMGVLSFEK